MNTHFPPWRQLIAFLFASCIGAAAQEAAVERQALAKSQLQRVTVEMSARCL